MDKEVMEPGGDRLAKNSYSYGKQPEAPASAPKQTTRESLVEIWEELFSILKQIVPFPKTGSCIAGWPQM